jgi:hypothetical protein
MAIIHFHDLPIYRLAEAEYDKELLKRTHVVIPDQASPKWKKADADARGDLLAHYLRYLGRWRFNEVVGYLRLSMSHRNIQGAYFGRRVREPGPRHDEPVLKEVRTRTKVFRSIRPLAPRRPIPRGSTNAECLGIIDAYVIACSRALPRRHLDQEWLREVGPYVNWCAMADASDT